jgi:hypothetical protein
MIPSPSSTQSAAERRSVEVKVRGLIAAHAPAHARLIHALRLRLRKRLPTAHELVYGYATWLVISYSPNEHGYAGVLALRASADGVKLYFNHGKGLPDPDHLLRGSATHVRWISVEGPSTVARPTVTRLIEAAIAGNPLAFARTGRGPVAIRGPSAKQPRRPTRTPPKKR